MKALKTLALIVVTAVLFGMFGLTILLAGATFFYGQ